MKKPVKKPAAKPATKRATKAAPKAAKKAPAKSADKPKPFTPAQRRSFRKLGAAVASLPADKPKSKAAIAAAAKNAEIARDDEATRLKRKETLTPAERARLLEIAPRADDTRWPSEIEIGERHRKEFGDITLLARSYNARNCMISRIAIESRPKQGQDLLVAGERRLRAWLHPTCKFRDDPIPVNAVDIDSIINGEWDENDPALRKPFTPSEAVAMKRAMEPRLKVAAAGRSRTGRKPEPGAVTGRSADIVGKMAGKSGRSIEKAQKVVEAAEARPGNPKYQKLVDDMDRTGRVDGPFHRLSILLQTDQLRDASPALQTDEPCDVVNIDYPWPQEPGATQEEIDERARSLRPYKAMAIEEGCKLFASEAFQKMLGETVVVTFWTTNYHMPYAYQLLQAMGFALTDIKTILTWEKDKIGRGQVLRDKTEHVLFAMRGKPLINLTNQTTSLHAKRRGNSEKPPEFFAMLEELFPAKRYADIFSGGGLGPKWICHGEPGRMLAGDRRAATATPAPAMPPPIEPEDERAVLHAFANGHRAGTKGQIAQLAGAGMVVTKGKRGLTDAGRARLEQLRGQAEAADAGDKSADEADWPDDAAINAAVGAIGGWQPKDLIEAARRAGHVPVTNTLDHAVTPSDAVATCKCGWTFRTPWKPDGYVNRDAAVEAHWREAAQPAPDAEVDAMPDENNTTSPSDATGPIHFRLKPRRHLPADAARIGSATNWANPYADHPVPAERRQMFLDHFNNIDSRRAAWMRANIGTLRGRDLACNCEPDADCGCCADVLIELANAPIAEPTPAAVAPADNADGLDIPTFLRRAASGAA